MELTFVVLLGLAAAQLAAVTAGYYSLLDPWHTRLLGWLEFEAPERAVRYAGALVGVGVASLFGWAFLPGQPWISAALVLGGAVVGSHPRKLLGCPWCQSFHWSLLAVAVQEDEPTLWWSLPVWGVAAVLITYQWGQPES